MEPAPNSPWDVLRGFLVGVSVWILGFATQFFVVILFNFAKVSFAVCPLMLVGFGVYFFRSRHERSAYTTGFLIAVCLGVLVSSACGVQFVSNLPWRG